VLDRAAGVSEATSEQVVVLPAAFNCANASRIAASPRDQCRWASACAVAVRPDHVPGGWVTACVNASGSTLKESAISDTRQRVGRRRIQVPEVDTGNAGRLRQNRQPQLHLAGPAMP
jgi:hypothetical protein